MYCFWIRGACVKVCVAVGIAEYTSKSMTVCIAWCGTLRSSCNSEEQRTGRAVQLFLQAPCHSGGHSGTLSYTLPCAVRHVLSLAVHRHRVYLCNASKVLLAYLCC